VSPAVLGRWATFLLGLLWLQVRLLGRGSGFDLLRQRVEEALLDPSFLLGLDFPSWEVAKEAGCEQGRCLEVR